MKKALSLLVAFMFLQTQTWALSGGPVYSNTASTDLTGVYAGVMVAKSATGQLPSINSQQASIGAFTVTVPISGAATGTTVFFQNNVAYTGTITGAADNGKRTITGIIQATTASYFVIVPAQINVPTITTTGVPPNQVVTVTFQTIPAVTSPQTATGSIEAKVSKNTVVNTGNQAINGVARSAANGGGVDANGNPVSLGETGDRLSGKAIIATLIQNDANPGGPTVAVSTTFSVSGIRQTNVIAAAVPAAP